jgi:hypothetical protein
VQTTLGLAAPVFYGRVQPELYKGTNPAVATGFTYVVGTDYSERPTALSFVLTTDSNAANRQVGLALLDPAGATLAAVPVASVQAASLVYTYSFLAQLSSGSTVQALRVMSPLFSWIIPPSYQLAVTIGSVQAGDQITAIRYYRDRFSTDPKDYEAGGLDFDSLLNSFRLAGAIVG